MKRALGICFLNNMGDNIVAWVACQELKRQFPDIIIDMVIPPERELLYKVLNKYVDNVIIYPKKRRGLKNVYDEIVFFRKLASNNYDIGFQMDYKEATIAKLYTLNPKHVGANLKLFFKNPYTIYTEKTKKIAGNFRTQMYLDNLRYAGLKPDYSQHLELTVKPEWIDAAARRLSVSVNDKLAVYCPFGAGPVQDMRPETYIRLTKYMSDKFDKVLVLGGGINTARAAQLVIDCGRNNIAVAADLQYSEIAGLLKRADLFLSVDTGPMHLGDAVGANLVAMYGYAKAVMNHWGVFGKNSFVTKSMTPGNEISHFYNYDPEIAMAAMEKKLRSVK